MTAPEQIELSGKRSNVIRATLTPAEPASERGLLLVTSGPAAAGLAERLARAGLNVLALTELPGDDREALADMESACAWLSSERGCTERFALGVGDAGTRAFLLGCTTSVLDGVIDVDGPLVLTELSRERPFQPLEMALNLSCPLLAVFAEDNAGVSATDRDHAAEVLSQFARTFDIVARPGDGRAPLDETVILRVLQFISETTD